MIPTGVVFELGVSVPVSSSHHQCEADLHDASKHEFYLVARAKTESKQTEQTHTKVFRNVLNTLHNFLQIFHSKLQVKAE